MTATLDAAQAAQAARTARTASPLAHGPKVVQATTSTHEGSWHTELAATIDPDEILFAGHYPGFPIFPGVCLIELVRLGAQDNAPDGKPARLATVRSTRFLAPTYPGDEISLFLSWRRVEGSEDRWHCRAQIGSQRGAAAVVVLELVPTEES